jgi:ubiquinone/menaquinone biosynthesis C-methylase UbiE
MISSKREMASLLKEMHRVLKKDSILVILTGSKHMHSPEMNWVSYETDFPENYHLKRGAPAKLRIRNNGAIFHDYNWFEEDYREAIISAGFDLKIVLSPKARKKETRKWFSEYTHSPFLIYLAKKSK